MYLAYLRLNGVNAREHPVFTELTRVKQYFDKLKTAENPPKPAKRELVLNKEVAKRFINADFVSALLVTQLALNSKRRSAVWDMVTMCS